jgi:hypothetical protein
MKPTSRTEQKQKQVLARLKIWLLEGKTITHNECLRMWRSSRLAEYIRRLRHDHQMKISTTMIRENGDVFGRYQLVTKEKKSKLLNP